MMFSSAPTRLIVVVAIIITMLKPTTAALGTFLKIVNGKRGSSADMNACHHTACTSNSNCAAGYNTLSTIVDGCPPMQNKKICCKSGLEPQCFFTGCGILQDCPRNYLKLDRTKDECSGIFDQAYCCKTSNLPDCFDLKCSSPSDPAKSCPPEYNETKRVKGPSGGCNSILAEHVTCCKRSVENNVNQSGSHSSSSHSPFAAFSHISLLLPTLIVVLSAFKSKFILLL